MMLAPNPRWVLDVVGRGLAVDIATPVRINDEINASFEVHKFGLFVSR